MGPIAISRPVTGRWLGKKGCGEAWVNQPAASAIGGHPIAEAGGKLATPERPPFNSHSTNANHCPHCAQQRGSWSPVEEVSFQHKARQKGEQDTKAESPSLGGSIRGSRACQGLFLPLKKRRLNRTSLKTPAERTWPLYLTD